MDQVTKRPMYRKVVAILVILCIAVAATFSLAQELNQAHKTSVPAPPSRLTEDQCANNLPLDFLAGQVFMVGLPAEGMSGQAALFKKYSIGGAVLMTSPADPYAGSIKKFKADSAVFNVMPLVSTDEEGGNIQRFSSLGTLPAPAEVAASMTTSQAQALIAKQAQKLKTIGVDMVLAPLADVDPAGGGGILGERAFSDNPNVVTSYDAAYIDGWRSAGVIPTLKHFPGLGSASANTDYTIATTPSFSELKVRDFVPYQQLAYKKPVIMVGNQTVPDWFAGPASLSPQVNLYLRQNLGYKDDLIVTDSLSAASVTSQTPEYQAIADAIKAGNDIALFVELPGSSLSANESLINQARTAIEDMVRSGTIPKKQLASSVSRKLNIEGLQACSIKTSIPG